MDIIISIAAVNIVVVVNLIIIDVVFVLPLVIIISSSNIDVIVEVVNSISTVVSQHSHTSAKLGP